MPSPSIASTNDVRELFDRIAPDYDRLNDLLSMGLHRVWKGMAIGRALVPTGGAGLDICCGSGDLALQMARAVGARGRVVGIDLSSNLLEIARQRSRRWHLSERTEWVCGDALALPFASQSFDAITMGYGLRNVVDIPQALAEIRRVLRPGARAVILDFQRLDNDAQGTLLAEFQQVYLDGIVVPMAARLGLEEEYRYIQDSLIQFPNGDEQVQLAISAGFEQPRFYDVAAGLMGMLVLENPDRSDRDTGV